MAHSRIQTALFILVGMAFIELVAGVGLSSSFWLDETVTAWIADGEFSRVTDLTLRYQGQSPLYFWIVWSFTSLFGRSELLFRLPSVFAAALTLWLVYRIARREMNPAASICAVLLLLANGDFVRALLSARPYALALLLSVAAVSAADRRVRNDSGLRLAIFLAVLSFYAHYLIGLSALALCLIWVGLHIGRGGRKVSLIEAVTILILLLSMVPGFQHLLQLSDRAADYRFAQSVTLPAVFKSLLPLDATAVFLIGSIAACCFMPKRLIGFAPVQITFFFRALLWMLVPPLVMIAISLASGSELLTGRYHLLAAPGAALLGAVLINRLRQESAQLIVAATIALLMLFIPRSWEIEPWRETAASIADESALTLVSTGLIEAERPHWLQNEENRAYLSVPLQVYRVPGQVLPISRTVEEAYLSQTVLPQLEFHKKIALVIAGRKEIAERVLKDYSTVLNGRGFSRVSNSSDQLVTVAEFSRTPSLVQP